MCGIAGYVAPLPASAEELRCTAKRMAGVLAHRGPDGEGVWTDAEAGVAIGHRRLSIIDPGPTGAQPAVSADGRYVLSYNGEIYNAPELAGELRTRGVRFRGHSDTEVLVEACALWGAEGAVERLNGMFAFALWDRLERRLFLARDRLGIKPLYWARFGALFLFGSELKALEAHGGWRPEIEPGAVSAFLRYGYVPTPTSIYKGVFKLAPGCTLSWHPGGPPAVRRYWDLRAVAQEGVDGRLSCSEDEAADALEALLSDAVRRQMVADVPVGCLLSGGIDSSLVAALMQKSGPRPIRTFSVGFREAEYDESVHARDVARRLGTDHTEVFVQPASVLESLSQLPDCYDEPFADASQIPTLIVSRLARGEVKVALSGDGGDELFGGYYRYFWAETIRQRTAAIPVPLRRAAAGVLRRLPRSAMEAGAALLPPDLRPARIGEKAGKLADILSLPDADAIYNRLVSQWYDPEAIVAGGIGSPSAPRRLDGGLPDPIERMQYLDSVTYLPDDILTKVDRASMSVGLEMRVPLLDHRVVAFAWRLPPRFKVQGRRGKIALRRLLYRRLPRALVDRPKQGFAIPLAEWLRGPLRPWAEDLLAEGRLRDTGLLAPPVVRERWAEHLSGARDWSYALWTVLMLMAWLGRERQDPIAHGGESARRAAAT